MAATSRTSRKNGQAVVFILMVLTTLVFALLWNADLHVLVTRKIKAQNAGDAAALAAARWQANTLNLVGELNLMHLEALEAGDEAAVDSATNMQARLCFAGPLTALAAAQAAAKKNGIKENREFTALLRKHAKEVLEYGTPIAGKPLFPEPYPGAWREYHDVLMEIADNGVAAAPDNALFFGDSSGGHILLEKGFYEAVAGREWCWFFLHCSTGGNRTILDDFTDYTWFAPLPEPARPLYCNSEIFGTGMTVQRVALGFMPELTGYLQMRNGDSIKAKALATVDNWYFHSPGMWRMQWDGMTEDDEDFLPMAGNVREEYDYAGADAVIRLYAQAPMLAFGGGESGEGVRDILWTAAAKPFGYLRDFGGGSRSGKLRPNSFGFVLPAYRDVRLIPMDAATSGGDGSFDIDWRRHIEEHLPPYLASGVLDGSCGFCGDIATFEDPAFRSRGSQWLSVNSYKCTLPSGGGGGRGGGSRRGH